MANIKIGITENGTTTLATAGKYCDRNIDVEVEVAGSGGGGGDIPEELLHYTGSCEDKFISPSWNWVIEDYGDRITTEALGATNSMFAENTSITNIPFTFNYGSAERVNVNKMFYGCTSLSSIGKINFPQSGVYSGSELFASCRVLEEIPEMTNFYFTSASGTLYQAFSVCANLREIPDYIGDVYSKISTTGKGSSSTYGGMFNNCKALLEIPCIPYFPGILTSNSMSNLVNKTYRAKRILFKYDEIPNAQWKSQTFDLSSYVGWHNDFSYLLSHNTNGTKLVQDDATYQALKDTDDWFTSDINYSRYNHDSAVETINNLPDTSAYLAANGGTNTIKFKGAAGALTDGGAINTLTEEEIAVAAAKGWTVSLV